MRAKKPLKSDVSVKSRRQNTEDAWRIPLENALINDEHWWCMVVLMIETIDDHSRCVSLFDAGAEEGKRRGILSLNYQKMIAAIRTTSKHNLDECPTIQGICHQANKVLIENDGVLPVWLIARVIKYLVLRTKMDSIGRIKKQAELDREIDEEYCAMQTVLDSARSPERSARSARSKKKTEGGERSKANTRLRKREEEWRDAVYVDDAPLNGPNLYVVLTGFHQPDLPEELTNVGVPLTCVLRIKRPYEELDRSPTNEGGTQRNSKVQRFFEEYRASRTDLLNFWTSMEKRLKDPIGHPALCDIVFLTFCPPEIPATPKNEEYEEWKRNVYDRVSYIVYDVYDLYRLHYRYLKSMRLETRIIRGTEEKSNMEIYRIVLDAVPWECMPIPTLLCAMLLQVEADDNKSSIDQSIEGRDGGGALEEDRTGVEREFEITGRTTRSLIEEKLKILDEKYELVDEVLADDKSVNFDDLELVLHGDILDLIERNFHVDGVPGKAGIPNANDVVDRISRILWQPRIMGLWRDLEPPSETKVRKYSLHLDGIRRYSDSKVNVSLEEVRHYLHVLVARKMISDGLSSSRNPTKNAKEEEPNSSSRNKELPLRKQQRSSSFISTTSLSMSFERRAISLPDFTIKSKTKTRRNSDSCIDYDKPVQGIIDSSPLFDLVDLKNLLIPRDHETNDLARKPLSIFEDYGHTELLSRQVFPQVIHQCFLSFDRFFLKYFEPTDTLLVCFDESDDANVQENVSSIRTPVCFREFCEYVVSEEENWTKLVEAEETERTGGRRLQSPVSTERLMKKTAEKYEETMIFSDEHFILPGSLKARDLGWSGDLLERKNLLETSLLEKREERRKKTKKEKKEGERPKKSTKKTRKTGERTKGSRQRHEGITSGKTSSKEKKRETGVDGLVDTSFLPRREILSFRCAGMDEPYEFLGYDLGRLRVQVTNRWKTFFSKRDTRVRIETEEWLYGSVDLRITIFARCCALRLFHRIGDSGGEDTFRLTTESGIILAFGKTSGRSDASENSSSPRRDWRDTNFDFRGSWPSGLLIEPTIGDGPENPFYIRQSYTEAASRRDNGIIPEVSRKFLRNGTVLKYLEDDTIIVLRPNGDVVTCIAFDEPGPREYEKILDNTKGDKTRSEPGRPSRERRPTTSLRSQFQGTTVESPVVAQQNSRTMDSRGGSVPPMAEVPDMLKVSRYTVLNHDGRQYEVLDDLVVSEHHRLLVRTASDYEVNEKFTRRADGTDMLLNPNGELIVTFPDGTRITTGYKIEEEPLVCDWTSEEIRRYFLPRSMNGEYRDSRSSSFHELSEEVSGSWASLNDEVTTEMLMADGFVSVLLTCSTEHKNYAAVFYDQSAVSCALSMPGDLRVSISRRGHYEVSMGTEVNLKTNDETLTFRCKEWEKDGSTSTYEFRKNRGPTSRTIFTTRRTGSRGVLEVKDDGTFAHREEDRTESRTAGRKFELNENIGGGDAGGYGWRGSYETLDEENDEEPEDKRRGYRRECQDVSTSSRYRLFAVNRDLTAYEYLRRDTVREVEATALENEETSTIVYPVSHRPELRRFITLQPVKCEPRSKLCTFRVGTVEKTSFNRKHPLRSTYSIPYDWLFPFGKNTDGIAGNTHDVPLSENIGRAMPKLLKIRILYDFKETGGNSPIDLGRALGCYWISLLHGSKDRHVGLVEKKGEDETKQEDENLKNLDDRLREFSLGIKKSIDASTYRAGLERKFETPRAKAPRESMEFVEILEQRTSTREELEWYKDCMRKKTVLPYFRNTVGSCFLWMEDCVEEALKASRTTRSPTSADLREPGG